MQKSPSRFLCKLPTTGGFSLVELLVALLFTSLLLAGMAKVFASSVKTFNTTNEVIGIQQNSRWAFDQINDDISQAGFIFPERTLPTSILNGAEPLFRIVPDQAVTGLLRVSDSNPGATEAEVLNADVLQFFTDVPLPIQGTWAIDTPGDDPNPGGISATAPTSAAVTCTVGAVGDLQAGDVEIILDSGENGKWEHPLVASTSGTSITFETDAVKLANYAASVMNPGITLSHKAGVPVYFVRPAQLVRYSVQALALDPSHNTVRVPCLVRQQAAYPIGGTVDWTTAASQVVAEDVAAFRVDISFDGGVSWARSGAANWGAIQTNANVQLATSGMAGFTSITDTSNIDWFRSIPCLLRVDITTRTAMRREEYNTAQGARAYRTRTQTLMIAPRNFGVGK
ncbi:PilW family protein [Holophaga foetida]|uniref:PilW family protein n=1 Tax=Holophaga foetida TaxID=35839 RepID=UPI0002475058|nr:hypothetical protein [Holophaga foetida]